ncbi:hypothetical protein QQ045_000975 [Rhodiola kirilowii]
MLNYIIVSQLDPKGKANVPHKVHKGGALTLDARIRPYVVTAGFYPWTQVCDVKVDPSLLTAVVKRWRPETHTFHFNDGEATITLQDVSLLTGLPIDGAPVTGKSQLKFEEVCVRLLGVYLDCDNKSPAMAKRSWFTNYLVEIPADADEEMLKKYARAYLVTLIGSTLFSNKSGNGLDPKVGLGYPKGVCCSIVMRYRRCDKEISYGDRMTRLCLSG